MTTTGTPEDVRPGGFVLSRALARNWWLILLRGIVAITFGVLAIFWPAATLVSLVLVWGVYAIADGVFSLWAAITGRASEMTPRWWLAIVGVMGVAAGIVAWVWPGPTALLFLWLIAMWAVIVGVMQIWGAIRLRKEIEGEWLLGLSGVLSILLGVILLLQPAAGAIAVVWWIAAFAIIIGVSYVGLALRLRKHAK